MVNIDLCDKYGVSDAETEMSLLVNCPWRRGAREDSCVCRLPVLTGYKL